LYRSCSGSERVVSFFNATSKPVSVEVVTGCLQGWKVDAATADSGEKPPVVSEADAESRIEISLPSRRMMNLRITLK
jgi:hypothetical protein